MNRYNQHFWRFQVFFDYSGPHFIFSYLEVSVCHPTTFRMYASALPKPFSFVSLLVVSCVDDTYCVIELMLIVDCFCYIFRMIWDMTSRCLLYVGASFILQADFVRVELSLTQILIWYQCWVKVCGLLVVYLVGHSHLIRWLWGWDPCPIKMCGWIPSSYEVALEMRSKLN